MKSLNPGKEKMHKKSCFRGKNKGQSLVELSLVLPLLLFLLIAFVEVGAMIYNYLSLLDVVREAARWAADQDPEIMNGDMSNLPTSPCDDGATHFFYDTACVVISSDFNKDIALNPATDDVAISVFTIDNNKVVDRKPPPPAPDVDGVWSLYSENWTKNCDGTLRSTTPFFPQTEGPPPDDWVSFTTPTSDGTATTIPTVPLGTDTPSGIIYGGPTDKGMVLVEIYYCHHQLLNLPIISDLIPDPIPLHVYTVMPAPRAAPTPTPLP
jgi:hypothetical protein